MLTKKEVEAIIELTQAEAEKAVQRRFNETEDEVRITPEQQKLFDYGWPYIRRSGLARTILRSMAVEDGPK
jgi:hypothetical protein